MTGDVDGRGKIGIRDTAVSEIFGKSHPKKSVTKMVACQAIAVTALAARLVAKTVTTSTPMIKGKFPNGLAAAMRAKGIGATWLAKQAQTSKQNVQRHAAGERRLTPEWAEKYAPYVGVPAEKMVFHTRKAPPVSRWARRPQVISVPLVSWVSAAEQSTLEYS